MTTIGTIVIIAALTALWLWTWRENVKLRRQAAEDVVMVFEDTKKSTKEWQKRIDEVRVERDDAKAELLKVEIEYIYARERLAKFETYKSLPRDEHGRFMKKGADPQIGQVSKG